jgi:hypothetical protein
MAGESSQVQAKKERAAGNSAHTRCLFTMNRSLVQAI